MLKIDNPQLLDWIVLNDSDRIYDIIITYAKNQLHDLGDLSSKINDLIDLLTKFATIDSFCVYLSNLKYFYDETQIKGKYIQQ